MAASLPGTQPVYTRLVDDPGGDPYSGAQVNVLYDDVEAVGTWFGAGLPITSGGGILLQIADGANTVGYTGQKGVYGLAGTPQTIIPGGSYDVVVGLVFAGLCSPSSGVAQGGVSVVLNGESVNIFESGSDIVSLAVAAGGQVTVTRDGGSLTYNIILNLLCWL